MSKPGQHTIRIAFAYAMACLLCGCLNSPREDLRVITDRRNIFIGDSIRLRVEVDTPRGTLVTFPDFKDSSMGAFEIRERSAVKIRKSVSGHASHAIEYTITTFKRGKVEIPALDVSCISGGRTFVKRTKAISVNVNRVVGEKDRPKDIRDIKGPLSYPASFLDIVLLVFAGLTLAAIVVLILKNIMKRRMKNETPREKALRQIEETRSLIASGHEHSDLYAQISWTVRTYIEEVFSIRAPEMTTEEFLSSPVVSSSLSDSHKKSLAEFMTACDLVKFADHRPSTQDGYSVCGKASTFVKETSDIREKERKGR